MADQSLLDMASQVSGSGGVSDASRWGSIASGLGKALGQIGARQPVNIAQHMAMLRAESAKQEQATRQQAMIKAHIEKLSRSPNIDTALQAAQAEAQPMIAQAAINQGGPQLPTGATAATQDPTVQAPAFRQPIMEMVARDVEANAPKPVLGKTDLQTLALLPTYEGKAKYIAGKLASVNPEVRTVGDDLVQYDPRDPKATVKEIYAGRGDPDKGLPATLKAAKQHLSPEEYATYAKKWVEYQIRPNKKAALPAALRAAKDSMSPEDYADYESQWLKKQLHTGGGLLTGLNIGIDENGNPFINFGKPATGKLQKDILSSGDLVGKWGAAKKEFDANAFTIGGKVNNMWSRLKDRAGKELSPDEYDDMLSFTASRATIADLINKQIKDQGGANVTAIEWQRYKPQFIMLGSEDNPFAGDGPNLVQIKMNHAHSLATSAHLRARYVAETGGTIEATAKTLPLRYGRQWLGDFYETAMNSKEVERQIGRKPTTKEIMDAWKDEVKAAEGG